MAAHALTERLLAFLGKGTELVKGKVWLQGTMIETEHIRATEVGKPLFFEPQLKTAQHPCMPTLLTYLETYAPVTPRGMLFCPTGEFSLKETKIGITLYLTDPRPWGQGEAIDVVDLSRVDRSELEETVQALADHSVSSFVFGRLIGRQNINGYVILRRYFRE